MESIFPQPIGLGDLLVDGVRPHVEWQSLMESSVEERNTGDAGKLFLAKSDNFQSREIVPSVTVGCQFAKQLCAEYVGTIATYSGARSSNASR